ncbi:MAG: HNH endonuclease [Planctomycetota bacterium]
MKTLRIAVAVPDFLCSFIEGILQIYSRFRYGRETRLISLGMGKFAMVDADDYPRLAQHTWSIKRDGTTCYAARFTVKSGRYRKEVRLMHREVFTAGKGMFVDHINGNGLDNRKVNLREATAMQNTWNRKKMRGNFSSRFKGVSWISRFGKWRAKISCGGKTIYLGYFKDEEAAARAYDAKAAQLYGKFAKRNFPE